MKSLVAAFATILLLVTGLILSQGTALGQESVFFDGYFFDKAMRIDFYHTGDAKEETIAINLIYQEEIWPGNKNNLLDPFNNGRYALLVSLSSSPWTLWEIRSVWMSRRGKNSQALRFLPKPAFFSYPQIR